MNATLLTKIRITVLHFLLLILPLIFTSNNDELFEFPKMLVVYAGALLCLGCWAIQSIQEKKVKIPRTPFDIPILIFVASQILSTVFSIDPHTSLYGYYSRFNGGLLSVFSYVILFYTAVSLITKENLSVYIRSLVGGGVLAALYAFPEHFGHSPSCLLITGSFGASCWVQDVQTRIFGTLGQPNWLAAYMVVLLPFVSAKISQIRWSIERFYTNLLWPMAFLLFSSVLLFTKSRSGILAVGIACTIQVILFFLFAPKNTNKAKLSLFVPLLTFALLTLVISNPLRDKVSGFLHVNLATQSETKAVGGTQLETGGSESGDIRRVVWTGAIKVWQRYPILGSGVETFAYSYYKDRPKEHNLLSEWDYLYNKAHNEFLNYLATTGLVGLVSYVTVYGSFVVLPLWWIYKKRPRSVLSGHRSIAIEVTTDTDYSADTISLLLAVSAALFGLAISNFFGFSTVVVSFLAFFLPAFGVILSDTKRILTIPLPKFFSRMVVAQITIAICVLLTLWSLLSVFSMWDVDRVFAKGKILLDQNETQDGALLIQEAAKRSPNEPVYEDKFAVTVAELSYILSTSNDSTRAAQLAQTAIDHSDLVIASHPSNVNFYKSRVRIFTLLAQISPVFYNEAYKALLAARELSPTDPKLTHNLALIAKAQEKPHEQEKYLKETIDLRPIDLSSRLELAALYEEQKKDAQALSEYQSVIQLDPENTTAVTRIASLSATKKKK